MNQNLDRRPRRSRSVGWAPRRDVVLRSCVLVIGVLWLAGLPARAGTADGLPKVRVSADGRGFTAGTNHSFVPFGVNYFRPGTGWAPQLWKQFDAEATRKDFQIMKALKVNCVRVFLSYGSFCQQPGELAREGLEKFDRFLALAEEAGIYVHPTGLDHWEGVPVWARGDRYAEEALLKAQLDFWRLFAKRYRGRHVIFAYDLLNEPMIRWESAPMTGKWRTWVKRHYETAEKARSAWGLKEVSRDDPPIPDPDRPREKLLLDYQHFRETLAVDWTGRQAEVIKEADPDALVTVGLIQWAVPALLPGLRNYAAFRPEQIAPFLDFLEFHFYPLNNGAYEYGSPEQELRNLSYLESVARAAAVPGKPLVLAEFGWYGGGKPTFDHGRHPFASEEDQARWCRRAVETTAGVATGWLNWGLYDHPQAGDVSQLTGLLTSDGKTKAWGKTFTALAGRFEQQQPNRSNAGPRPQLDWDRCLTSREAADRFREAYFQAFRKQFSEPAATAPGPLEKR